MDKPKLERVATAKKDKDKEKKVAKADTNDARAQDPVAADDDDLDDAELSPKEKADAIDPIKTESLSIMEDVIEQQRHGKLAATVKAKP